MDIASAIFGILFDVFAIGFSVWAGLDFESAITVVPAVLFAVLGGLLTWMGFT